MNQDPKYVLIKYRLALAEEMLTDARKLLEVQGSPRSIINRSYYTMFYATLAVLTTIDQGAAKHSGVISLFDRHFVKTGIFPRERVSHYTALLSCASKGITAMSV